MTQLQISRRNLLRVPALLAGGAACTAVAGCGSSRPSPPPPRLPSLELLAPTGPYAVGRVSLHLVDPARTDPRLSGNTSRELMVHLWYPAATGSSGAFAPWLGAAAAVRFRDRLVPAGPSGPGPAVGSAPAGGGGAAPGGAPPSGPPGGLSPGANGVQGGGPVLKPMPGATSAAAPVRLGAFRFPSSHARWGAAARTDLSAPVVLWSPGHGDPGALGTQLVEELASQGHAVVTIDHTYDAAVVEFPGGRVEAAPSGSKAVDIGESLGVRIADVRFVLDRLAVAKAGSSPARIASGCRTASRPCSTPAASASWVIRWAARPPPV